MSFPVRPFLSAFSECEQLSIAKKQSDNATQITGLPKDEGGGSEKSRRQEKGRRRQRHLGKVTETGPKSQSKGFAFTTIFYFAIIFSPQRDSR